MHYLAINPYLLALAAATTYLQDQKVSEKQVPDENNFLSKAKQPTVSSCNILENSSLSKPLDLSVSKPESVITETTKNLISQDNYPQKSHTTTFYSSSSGSFISPSFSNSSSNTPAPSNRFPFSLQQPYSWISSDNALSYLKLLAQNHRNVPSAQASLWSRYLQDSFSLKNLSTGAMPSPLLKTKETNTTDSVSITAIPDITPAGILKIPSQEKPISSLSLPLFSSDKSPCLKQSAFDSERSHSGNNGGFKPHLWQTPQQTDISAFRAKLPGYGSGVSSTSAIRFPCFSASPNPRPTDLKQQLDRTKIAIRASSAASSFPAAPI